MQKPLSRLLAVAVVLALPTGMFAQSASAEKKTETKNTTNPVTGTQTKSTESTSSSNTGGVKKKTHRKHTTSHAKKKTTTTDQSKTTTETKPSGSK
jgi:cytoskeletal protein RodZ